MRFLSSLLAALSLLACAPKVESAVKSDRGNGAATSPAAAAAMNAQADAMRTMLVVQQAQRDAEKTCGALDAQPIVTAEEELVGRDLAIAHARSLGPLRTNPTDALALRVVAVGQKLARASPRPDLHWVFGVVDSTAAEAWSGPGGYVLVTTGLLQKMQNEAQLAGVLAHEVAHVSLKHPLTTYRTARTERCRVALVAKAALSQGLAGAAGETARFAQHFEAFDLDKADEPFMRFILDAVIQVQALAGYPADGEFAADAMGLHLVASAGFDMKEYETLLTAQGEQPRHPKSADRALKLKALREGELAPFSAGSTKAPFSVTP